MGNYLPFGRLHEGPVNAREKVLESAIRVFARRGYAGTSVQEILRATGLSKPTLYYHFGSKAGLYRAILAYAYDESHERMRSAVGAGGDCEARLSGAAEALFQFTLAHEDLMRLVFATLFAAREEVPPDAIDPARRRRNLELVREVLAAGQRAGDIAAGPSAMELTHAIFGAISHSIRTHLFHPEGALDRRRAARIVALFLDGARPRR